MLNLLNFSRHAVSVLLISGTFFMSQMSMAVPPEQQDESSAQERRFYKNKKYLMAFVAVSGAVVTIVAKTHKSGDETSLRRYLGDSEVFQSESSHAALVVSYGAQPEVAEAAETFGRGSGYGAILNQCILDFSMKSLDFLDNPPYLREFPIIQSVITFMQTPAALRIFKSPFKLKSVDQNDLDEAEAIRKLLAGVVRAVPELSDIERVELVRCSTNALLKYDKATSLDFSVQSELALAIKYRRGVCRHFAVLAEELGSVLEIDIHAVSGFLDQSPHVFAEARIGDRWYQFEPQEKGTYFDYSGEYAPLLRKDLITWIASCTILGVVQFGIIEPLLLPQIRQILNSEK